MTARKKKPAGDDAALRAAFLAAALAHVPFDGFSDKMMERAGGESGIDKETAARLLPEGALSLIEFFSDHSDEQMRGALAAMDLPALKVRQRITEAVKARIAVLRPHKEAARRAAAFLTLPMHAALGARLLYRTVDAIWRAVGDTSTDFNFYTKRGILAGVYSATLMRWFNDTSEGEAATDEFLAARIENVMQFEKLKARAKKGLAGITEMIAGRGKPEQ